MATDYNGRNIWTATDGSPVTTYQVDSDRRAIDIASDIAQLMPEATPFLTILMKARKVPVNSQEFIWYDQDEQSWWTELASSYSAGTAHTSDTISVADASFLRKKDLIKNASTGEIMRITDISGTTLTVDRGYGYDSAASSGTDAVASTGSDDNIMRLSNAMEENSNAPGSYSTQPTKLWNLVHTFRTPFDSSLANQLEAKRAGEDPRTRLRKQKVIEHRLDIEKQITFGERYEDLTNNIRTTGGFIQYINSNSYDVDSTNGGILTEAEWENFCEMAFDWGSPTKLFVTSPRVGSIINQFAAGRIDTTSEQETYGMKLAKYISFHGNVILATSKLFKKDYADTGLMIDIENIDYRPFGGMDSKLMTNIQDNDLLGWKDEYVTMAGLRVRKEKTHSIISGISA